MNAMPQRKIKAGRPRVSAPRENVTMRFMPEQLKRLDALAEKKGTTRTALIQIAVAELLEKKS
jgi:predicted DNA-binding protein